MATLLSEAQRSFAGGMNDGAALEMLSPDEVSLLLNYWITPTGRAEVRGGSKRLHETALNSGEPGYGITEFTTHAGVRQLVAIAGDSAYVSEDEGETWTAIAGTDAGGSALHAGYWSFATFTTGAATYLLMANGGSAAHKWDGTTWSAISNITADTDLIATHNERVWGHASGVLVEASKIRDPETWAAPDGLDLYVVTHDGDSKVTGFYSIGSLLLVFKRRSLAYIDGYGNSDVIVASGARGVSRNVGCIAPRTIQGVDSGVMWLSERGFEYYAPGGEPRLVSEKVEGYLQGVNWSTILESPTIPTAYYDPNRRAYVCWLPGPSGTNEFAFVYRLPTANQPGAAGFFTAPPPEGGSTLYVDGNGFLQVEEGAGRQQAVIVSGFLELAGTEDVGVYVEIVDGFLELVTTEIAPASTCTADFVSNPGATLAICYDGFVRQLDVGDLDDTLADGTGGTAVGDRLRTRGFTFAQPFLRKRARRVHLRARSAAAITPAVTLIADGSAGDSRDVEIPAGTEQSRQGISRVSRRGNVLQVEVRRAGPGAEIESVLVEAEVERIRR